MSIVDFLSDLRRAGIHISLNDDKLKIKAPSGALTNEIKVELKNRKEEIIAFLQESSKAVDTSTIPVIDRDGQLPLSFSQQGLWFIDQMHPGSVAYNMPFAVKLVGEINLPALSAAVSEIIRRHESLRTRFLQTDQGVPYVVIDPARDYSIEQSETSVSGDLNEALLKLAGDEARRPFKLSEGALFRFKLIQVQHKQGDVSLLLGSIHHIISDGWSMSVLLREIAVLYAANLQGIASPLPPLPIQYPDFAAWQRDFLQGENLEQQLGFWRQQLRGIPSLLALPTDRVRPAEQTSNGSKYEFKLNDEVVSSLDAHCKELGITLFTGLMAAWQLLLSKYAQQELFCVGIPMAGRSRKETENLIGFFVNALLVKADLRNNPTVAEFVERVKDVVLGAFSHQDVPLQLILDDLNVPRSLAHQPLAQVGFQLQNFSGQGASGVEAAMIEQVAAATNLKMEPVVSDEAASKYDMILTLVQNGGSISGNVEYNTDLFDRETIAKMIQHFERTMDIVVEQPDMPVSRVAIASQQEIREAIGVTEAEGELLPLCNAQLELLLDAQVNPTSIQNAIGYWIVINSELDLNIFQQAVAHVCEHTRILDARFYTCDLPYADPGYQVHPLKPQTHFEFDDYSDRQLSGESPELVADVDGWIYRARDVFAGGLYITRLIKLSEVEYVLAAYSHHLVSDGLSLTSHVKRLAKTYQCMCQGDKLPTWKNLYADHVQQDQLELDRTAVTDYWRKTLANVEPLNFSVPAEAKPESDFVILREDLTDAETAIIRDYCNDNKVHPSELFRLITAYLVKTYCRPENDFVLLEIQGGRNRRNYDQIGVYYQQVPFVVDGALLQGDVSVDDFYAYAKETLEQLKPYRYLSMAKQRELIGQGRLSFQYNYYNFIREVAFAESNTTPSYCSPRPEGVAQIVIRDEACFSITLMFETEIFANQGFVQRMKALALKIAQGEARAINQLDLLSEQERVQLTAWNETQRSLPACESVVDWFDGQTARTPDNVAVIFGEAKLSYQELHDKANQLANYLLEKGVSQRDRVAISVGRSLEMVIAVWGVLKAGCTYIPVDVNYPKERLAYLIEDSQAKALITESCMLDRLPETAAIRIVIDNELEQIQAQSITAPQLKISGQDLIYIIYTSGSTGKPKGAAVRHHGEVNLLSWYTRDLNLTAADKALVISAFGFDLTQKNLFALLMVGGTLVIPAMDQYDDGIVIQAIEQNNITLLNCAPSAFYPLVDSIENNELDETRAQSLASLRYLVLGGEPIRLAALYPWLSNPACGCQLVNSYGPTECTDVVSYHILDQVDPLQTLIPIGKPVNNTQLYIVDEELNQLPIGLVGELCIAGDGVGAGYIGRDDLTADVFVDNPFGTGKLYKTGDLARYLSDGAIEYIGRKDFQIKLRGLRIELGEIEHALRQLTGVSDGLALVLNEQLVAYAVVDKAFDKNAWRSAIADYLPDYMIPAHVVPLERWPLTPNGKIDRKALPAPDQQSRRVEFVAPRTEVEKILAQIWSQVLKIEEVGIYDNFFDLGGHSLLATQVASRARKAFHSNIQLRDLLGEPTIASIALQVEKLIRSGGERAAAIEPISREQRLPLSFAQQRLWLLDKIEPGSVAYNVPLAVEITGNLNVTALREAFQALVTRHEVLRTRFIQDDQGACLAIESESVFALPVVEIVGLNTAEELTAEVRRLVAIEVMTPFHLDKAPLMRAKLFQTGEQRYVLSVVLHHIVTDGWSMGLLIKELGALYVAAINKEPASLSSLALQYADYAYWQRSQISEEVLESHLDFWREQLFAVPALNLPTDFPRPAVQTYKGNSVHFSLPDEVKRQFKDIARQQNTTLFNVLLAAYGAFLHRYTGQDDFAIGSPVAGRDDAELETLVGFFVNTLVVRQSFAGIEHFNQLVNGVSTRVLDCEAHQQIPFEQIVEVVDPVRDMSRSPVFQTMLVYQNLPVDSESLAATETQLGDISFSPLGLDVETAKFELMLTVVEGDETQPFHCQLQYNTDLFATKTAENLAQHFRLFCQSLAAHPEQSLHSHQLLSEAEITTQLVHWNQTQVDYDKSITVQQQFTETAARFPDFTAVKCGAKFLSYQQLNNVANAIAMALVAKGVKPNDKVGLCFNRHLGLMPAIIGILKAGATYVPLDASYPEGRIRYIVEDAAIPLVVSTEAIATSLEFDGIQFFAIDEYLTQADTVVDNVEKDPDSERLLYMIYTSGSTGRPKGTGAYQRSEINLLNWYRRQFKMTAQDRLLLMSAIGFDLTQKNLFAPLLSGATLVVPEFQEFDPALLIPLIKQEQISWINCAPSAFYSLQDDSDNWASLGSLRHLFLGGEPINLKRLSNWLEQSNCQLINSYGPTECTDISNWHCIDLEAEAKHAVLAIGRPNDNVRLYILGVHQELLPVGAVGELCIGGDSVGPGYLNNQELTQQVFIQNPFSKEPDIIYRTGDLARYREDGTVEYLGRRDQQIKLRGFRIETGEIQGVINEHAHVIDSLVSVVTTEAGEQLVAWVISDTPETEYETLIEALRTHTAHYLPNHMIPGAWRCLAEFPLTPNGKIDRRALPQHSFADDRPMIEPRTDLEKTVAQAWCAVLGVDRISVDQNFFQLGGHSLLATKVVARLSKELNQEIPVRLLFEANTVEQFAERVFALQATSSAHQKPPVQALGLSDDIPLTLAQQRLWLFEQLNPGTATNNMPAAVRLKGRFNLKAVQRAVTELIRRHDALRTIFYLNESEQPRQRVIPQHRSQGAAINVTDLRCDDDASSKAILLAGQDRSQPFDLLRGPLFRTGILQLADDEFVLMINMHHIISDGVSVNVILRELMTLYYTFDQNIPSPLPELALQYSDYAVWQQRYLQGGVLEEQLNYWDEQLAKAPMLSTFPTDNPRPAVQTTNGRSHHFQFDPAFAKQLHHYCQQQGMTPFMFMFALWSLLLCRYSGQQDLCIGIPTAGRHQPELDNIVGFFINSMVLRVDFSGNPSAQEHLDRVKDVVLNGFAHGDVPIETIVDRLALERNPAFTPLVQTAFQLLVDEKTLDAGAISEHFADLDIEIIATEGVSAKFDMLLTLNQGDDYLLGSLEYNTDLYRDATVEKICKQYIALAKAIMADASHSYTQYPLYKDSEIYAHLGLQAEQYERLMPLTTTQEAFLWHLQIHPDTEQYCVGFAYEIRRSLDLEKFTQALQFVINEFSALRAEFHLSDLPGAAMAYQAVRKEKTLVFEVQDVSDQVGHLPVDERQQALKPTYEALAYHSYNVEKDPLIVFKLLKTADDHYIYLFQGHHIVVDGIAGRALLDKTLETYLAIEAEQRPLGYTDLYPDYIVEHNDKMDKPAAESFWREELAAVEPLDFSKPPMFPDDQQYHVQYHLLSAEKGELIKQYCRKQRIHPSIYFRFLSAVLLTQYCRAENDFVVYEIQSGRSAGHEDAMGVYYQQVPFHYEKKLFEKESFPADFYQQQKLYRKKIRGHLDVSLALQDAIVGHGRIGFQYNYFNFLQEASFGDLAAIPDVQSSHVEDTVQVFIKETGKTFSLELWFDGKVFIPLDFLQRLEQVSDQLCQGQVEQVGDFNLVLAKEAQQYEIWNSTAQNLPEFETVVSWFESQVIKSQDLPAVICGADSLTYQQLNTQANQLSHWLIDRGVKPGDFVAICLDRSVDMLVALWGVLKAGASYVPIEATYPVERMRYMLEDSNASALLTQKCLGDKFEGYTKALLLLDEAVDVLAQQSTDNPQVPLTGDDGIYIIYTSGSTGQPKGAQVHHRGEINLQQWYINRNGLTGDDRVLIISAFGFDLTQKNFYAPLLVGGCIIIPDVEGYDPVAFRSLIDEKQVTLLNCAPSAFYPIVESIPESDHQGPASMSSLRAVWLGGEPIRMESLVAWYRTNDTVLVNSYGPTECTDVVAAYDIPKDFQSDDVIPIGNAIDNSRIYILSDNDQLCPPGIIGEVCIAGVCVGRGYLNKSELTEQAFVAHPLVGESEKLYRTGDLGRYLPTGDIEYIGRKDFQIKLRGLRIELGEIEYALRQLPGIKDGMVVVKSLGEQGDATEQLIAYGLIEKSFELPDWRERLANYLPDYMIPGYLITVNEWPLTPNGKVDRKALPEPDLSQRRVPYVAPRNDLEATVAEIWSQVLNVDQVGVNDNFFDLGGHSLLATQIASRIRRDLNINLQIRDLLGEPTVAAIAELLASMDAKKDSRPPIKALNLETDIPLSLGQQRLWFFEQMNPGTVANNMPAAIRLRGDLSVAALKAAFMEVSHRHHALRSVFYMGEDGQPKQRILADTGPLIEVVDLTQVAAKDIEKEVMSRVAADRATAFDLSAGPLLRAQLLCLSQANPAMEIKAEWVLLLCMHHIISDGFSINILLNELTTLYYVYANQMPSPLPALPVQYTDFAVWQRTQLQGELLDQQLAYWDTKLAKAPKLSTFPTDKPRPGVQTTNGTNLNFAFGEGFADKLAQYCRETGLTPFMFTFCVWSLLLSRYNGQRDLCIGIPTAGRHVPELENLIGFFINSMVLRPDLQGNPSASELLQRTKNLVLDGFANADVPIEMVLERLPLERNPAYTPLVQTAFQLLVNEQQATSDNLAQTFAGLEVEPIQGGGVSAKFDMLLTLNMAQGQLHGTLEYNTDLYLPETAQRVVNQFMRLANDILENDSHSISNYELYSQAELLTALDLEAEKYEQILPLTTTQEAFLLNLQLNPDTVQYSVGYSYEIFRPLDLELWQQAMEQVMQQSVIMRAEFHLCDMDGAKTAYQAIRKQRNEVVQHCDVLAEFDGNPKPNREQIVNWIENWVYQPFDMNNDELVNYRLLKLADDHYQFACRVHHIAMDGIAGRSSMDKFLATYSALESGEALPVYEDRFVEYVYQHVDEIDRPSVEAFWREELQDAEPLDFSKPPVFFDDNQYHVLKHGIDAEKTRQIKQYCRKQRLHPSIYFRYLSMVLLHTYCRAENDFVVYEIGGGRGAGHEDSIGVYYQQIPYHYEKQLFEGSATPKDFYNQQKQYRKKLKGNTNISLQLQDAIIGSGRIGFQYNYFNFLQVIPFGESSAMLEMQSSHVENTVQVFIKEFDDTFSLELWYDGRVFNPLDFLPRMEKLSDQLSSSAIDSVADFEFLLAHEKLTYSEWNAQTRQLPEYSSVVAWFEAQAAETPNATAVICGDNHLNYESLNNQANQLAHWLTQEKIGRTDFVGICLDRSVDMLVALLGVLKTGAAYLPIEASYPKDRIAYMLADSGARVLLTQSNLTDKFVETDFTGELLLLDQQREMFAQQSTDNPNVSIDVHDIIYMIYTSGSTGKPKGAQVSHLGELNLQNWYINRNGLQATDRILVMSAFGFDLTQKNFFAPLLSGGAVVLPDTEGYDPVRFTQLIADKEVSLLNCAPSAFYPMVEHCVGDYQSLTSLRSVWLGGEPIRMDALLDWYQTSKTLLVNSYGPTECTDVVAAYDVPKDFQAGDVLPIGGAIENTQLFIVNGNQQICPPGITGEICIAGICVGNGYLGKDDLTQEAFIENPYGEGKLYRTGDLGRYLPTGDIEYIGRKDFQVKLRGLRIELGEIETALKSIPDIDDALVLVHEDVLVAYTLVAHSGLAYAGVENDFDVSDWRVILRDKLPDYMVPNHIITLEAWPLTPNGKVDRQALPKPSAGSRSVAFVAPRNAIEKALQQIWMAVLELDQIGVKDNFFEIGGHSILGVRIIARVDQELGVNLQAVDLLNCQTIEKLAEKVQEQGVADVFSPLVTLKANNSERNLFFIHPIGGDVLCYRELSEHLSANVNVFGLRCRGLDIKDPVYSSLDEMVSDYVEAILKVQASGDIYLAGQSLGGVLGVAVANELTRRGVNTLQLIMLDTYAPDHLHQYFGDEVDMIQAALGIEFPPQVHELKQKNPEQWLLMLYNMMKSFGVLTDDVTFERVTAIYQVVVNNFGFSANYQIDWSALPPILHYSASDSQNRVKASDSWQTASGYVGDSFTWFDANGDHETIMQNDNAVALAELINSMLAS